MKEILQNWRAAYVERGAHYYMRTALICNDVRWRYAPELAGYSCISIPGFVRMRDFCRAKRARSPSGKRAHQNDEHDVQYSLHYRRGRRVSLPQTDYLPLQLPWHCRTGTCGQPFPMRSWYGQRSQAPPGLCERGRGLSLALERSRARPWNVSRFCGKRAPSAATSLEGTLMHTSDCRPAAQAPYTR